MNWKDREEKINDKIWNFMILLSNVKNFRIYNNNMITVPFIIEDRGRYLHINVV